MKHVSCLAALLSASLAVAQEPSTDAGEMDAVVSSAPADAGMDAGIDAGSAAALWEKPVTFPLDAASRTAREGKDGVLLETRVLIDRAGAGADRAVLLHVTAYAGIDLFLAARAQGRGLGRAAIRAVARWLIDERGHHRLTIDPAAANERAIRAYTALGFRPVGTLRQYERRPDGSWVDGLLMELLADELVE